MKNPNSFVLCSLGDVEKVFFNRKAHKIIAKNAKPKH